MRPPKLRVQKNNEANVTGVGHYEVAWWRKYTSYSTWNYSKRPGFPLISRLPDGSVRPLLLPGSPERPTDFGFGVQGIRSQLPLGEGVERLEPKVVLQHRQRHSNATRIGRIYHGTRGIHSPPTVRPQPHTGEFQGWAVAVAAVDPSGAVATTACGVCWGKCGVLGLGVAFGL